ncbi:hypothetical protein T4E_8226 [Trichinella pseudospiralis]|uniref:Uncharacterized protein n=1 Tax=Trichinella pseudospiralis TaxID=6337 RepID=A0A0V0Y662_TRIPS|nr:hypothetical protein T4E_8226 [Trichinella pseudospiralis]
MCTTPPEVISYQVFHCASSSQDISGVVASGAVSPPLRIPVPLEPSKCYLAVCPTDNLTKFHF